MMPAATGQPTSGLESTPRPLFAVRNLWVDFLTADGPVRAVDGVDFAVDSGRTLGIVGKSGSGKTVSTLAALGLLPGRTPIRVSGSAEFDGVDLLALPARSRREHLGRDIGVVFQDPVDALDPVERIGEQIVETLGLRDSHLTRHAARANAYPHQFSGGMCQRVVIAIAMANRSRLVIADEPATAADATVQAQLLELNLPAHSRHADKLLSMINAINAPPAAWPAHRHTRPDQHHPDTPTQGQPLPAARRHPPQDQLHQSKITTAPTRWIQAQRLEITLHDFAQNEIWLAIVALVCDLTAWMQMLAFTKQAARRWEPKRLRLRLLSIPGTLAQGARRTRLRLSARAPHVAVIIAAIDRLTTIRLVT